MAVVIDQGHGFKPFAPRPPRCKLQSYTQLNDPIKFDYAQKNIHKSLSTPCLSTKVMDGSDTSSSRIEIIVGHSAPRVRTLVVEVAIAMASGVSPEPASSGLGGAYFLRSRNGDKIAVAKPIDEEPLAFNNPKGFATGRMLGQPGMKSSIRIGETGLRESAAYLLDHDSFSGVPPTALVKFSHVKFNLNPVLSSDLPSSIHKIASLQHFVTHDSDAGDLGPSSFSVTCVHHIGILDVRLMNLDRHAGNILVRHVNDSYGQGKAELVPIDHGFCLPESLDDPYFEWLHWPQASIPFSECEVDYISNLDPYKDAELLRAELPSLRESSIRILVLCTIFLKEATTSGLSLADIGQMMTREFQSGEENWSSLEKLCINLKSSLKIGLADDDGANSDNEEDEMFEIDNDLEHASRLLLQHPVKVKPSPRVSVSFNFKNEKQQVDNRDLETILDDCTSENDNGDNGCGMMRSLSFPVPKYNHDGQGISFGDLNDEEWGMFLHSFKVVLPQAFEERKSLCLLKQRLGTSCEF